ncbi:hypothetical protein HCN58_34265 [Bradyrhizobium sp. WSM 1791]|uniref:Uncharacterized protein n=1 Tax=Bradyrhizobium australiense TaxID=2721161 RepID=A0A7Y4GYX1_9BRAD|nr:hypothetical protein [Bradyrhizobium australiense]
MHCASVTQADLHYDGSISIDRALMEAATTHPAAMNGTSATSGELGGVSHIGR